MEQAIHTDGEYSKSSIMVPSDTRVIVIEKKDGDNVIIKYEKGKVRIIVN